MPPIIDMRVFVVEHIVTEAVKLPFEFAKQVSRPIDACNEHERMRVWQRVHGSYFAASGSAINSRKWLRVAATVTVTEVGSGSTRARERVGAVLSGSKAK